MAVFLGNLDDGVIVDQFFLDVFVRALQNRIGDIRSRVKLSPKHSMIELGPRKSGHEAWFLEAEHPGKQPAIDIDVVTDGLSADAQAAMGTKLLQVVQPQFGDRAENILRGAVGRAEVNELVDVVLNAHGPEHGVGDQA